MTDRKYLYLLAMEYHSRCESYDESVCTGMRNGVAVPVTSKEANLVSEHSKSILEELTLRLAVHSRISDWDARSELKDVISAVSKEFEDMWEKSSGKAIQ